jgi:hypothetical protein
MNHVVVLLGGEEFTRSGGTSHIVLFGVARMLMVYVSLVGVTGFEPATSWSQTTRSSQAELHPAVLSWVA